MPCEFLSVVHYYLLHQLCYRATTGEGFYQVLETVESGLLADDEDADNNGDVSEQKPATADPGTHNSTLQDITLFDTVCVRHGHSQRGCLGHSQPQR